MLEKNFKRIYRWGNPEYKEKLPKSAEEFLQKRFGNLGTTSEELLQIKLSKGNSLPKLVCQQLKKIVGSSNYSDTDFERARHSLGRYYLEILEAKKGIFKNTPDLVLMPKTEKQLLQILEICKKNTIPVIPFGGNTSVTKALEAKKGGISLDMKHFDQILDLNETNSTVKVQAGVFGPKLESYLNQRGYTCGHFPQSFEFSTVGGWLAAKGAGQASTGYGKIEDIALAVKVICPEGVIETKAYPAASIGPDIHRLFIGSEGAFGIITEVTLKIRKYNPKNSSKSSFIFKDFETACMAMREIMQAGFGKPHFFRLQDPEETDIAFEMSGKARSFSDKALRFLGYEPMKRSLLYAIIDGDRDYTKFVLNKIRKVVKKYKGFETGNHPVEKWLEQRYSSAYLRDTLMDRGMMIDTLETAVTWDNLIPLWKKTREYIKSKENTACLVHISHAYENGANLYFIFMCPMDKEKEAEVFSKFHKGLVETIHKQGGSLSHHHGIGKLFSPLIKEEIGSLALSTLQSIKNNLDKKGIMNPGGTIGLR
jgi:alkyldihydroxyacetonephosphate synthase